MNKQSMLERRISRLERLLKYESDEAEYDSSSDEYSSVSSSNRSSRNSDDEYENPYEPKYIRAAQRLSDLMDEIAARMESIPQEFDTLHLDKSVLYEIEDRLNSIKEDAQAWLV